MASLIPIALLLHRLNRESTFSFPLTIARVLGSVVRVAIGIGLMTELAAFGQGFIGGPTYWAATLMVGIWLVGANAVIVNRTCATNRLFATIELRNWRGPRAFFAGSKGDQPRRRVRIDTLVRASCTGRRK